MAEPVTTQPNKNSGNSFELNDLNEEQLQANRIREEEDDCCDSFLKCYCLRKCLRNCLKGISECEPNSNYGDYDSVDDGFEARNDDMDVFSSNEPEEYNNDVDYSNNYDSQNNDNDYSGYNCDNDYGASTYDAGDSGGGDYGGCTSDD